jgi:hypothetical protein
MTVAVAVDRAASGPYRYLDYFQDNESDRLSFAGRDDDIAEVAARASSDEPFVLYGRSGLGKTSLLLAGVFPLLRERRLHPVRVRVFDRPDVDLRNALAGELELESGDSADDLNALVARLAAREGLVLVFDQFEELFINTRRRPAVRRDFIHLLATLVRRPDWDVRLTLSLREEFLAELDEFRDDFPDILANQYRLLPLTAFGARQAIVTPLVHSNIPFDQELVVKLVDLLAKVDFDPVLLQIACGEVYREAVNRQADQVRLTAEDLDRVGGISGLFSRYLDNAIRGVPDGILLLSRAVLDALITPEETKRAITFDALLANDDFNASIDELKKVLGCLKTQKLVRDDLRSGHLWYELTHDRLAPSIVKWFRRDTDFAQFRDARDLIAEAARRAAYPARLETLIGRPQIDGLINPYRQRLRLTAEQRALMLWSALYGQAEHVDFWAALAGEPNCENALLALLEHSSSEARLGAARTAARLPGRMPAVAKTCAALALHDQDPAVRQAAAVALSRHADEDQIEQIRTALKSRRTRRHALDLLATFVEAGGPIERFGRFSRLLARRHARRRTLTANSTAIIARGRRGVLVGFLSSAAWTASVGLLMASVATWAAGEIEWRSTTLQSASVVGAIAALAGIVGGWWLGRAAGKRAAITGVEGRWGWAIFRVSATLLLPGWILVGLLGDSDETLMLFPALVALCIVLPGYIALIRGVIWPPHTTRLGGRVFWAFLAGLPTAVPIALVALSQPAWAEALWTGAGVVSALTTIVVLVTSESSVAHPLGTFPPDAIRARHVGRGLLLTAGTTAAVALWLAFGADSLPFAASAIPMDGGGRVPINLRTGIDSSYFRITTTNQSPGWFVARVSEDISIQGLNTTISARSQSRELRIVHLPPGGHLMSATTSSARASHGEFQLDAIRRLAANDAIEPSHTQWTPFILVLEELPADGETTRIWRAELPVRVAGAKLKPSEATLWLRPLIAGVAFDQSAAALKERLISYTPPPERATFLVPEPPAQVSAYVRGRELQGFEIDGEGLVRLQVTFRSKDPDLPGAPIALPVGLKLVRSFDWGHDWDNADALQDAANKKLLSKAPRDLDEAVGLFERVAELRPGDADAQNDYAWALVTANRGAEGIDAARRAVGLTSRKNANLLDTLAHVEYAAGNWAEAVRAWEDVLAIDAYYYQPPRDLLCERDQDRLEDARRRRDGV